MSANCERARAWASLRLDGELSELEDALLTAHVRRCTACREYQEMVSAVVIVLRAQPVERVAHPLAVPSRRRAIVRPFAAARAAAIAAAIIGVTTVLTTQPGNDPTGSFGSSGNVPVIATADNDIQQLRELRVIQLGGDPPQRSGVGEFGAVLSQRP